MADLIEIPIVVKDQNLKQAITTVTRLERELTRAVKAVDNNTMSQRRFNQILDSAKKEYKQYATNAGLAVINVNKFVRLQKEALEATRNNSAVMAQQARASQDFYRSLQQVNLAQKEASASAESFSDRLDYLGQKYNPLYAASKRYEKMLRELDEAHRMGVISATRHEEALEQLNAELARGTSGMGGFGNAAGATRQRMSRTSVAIQQTGYQVGDFLVQVQGGTNAFVAFGQQATQLAGLLTMSMNPKIIALGAALSILIPLTTAIAAFFMRARKEGEETGSALERMSGALNDIGSLAAPVGNSLQSSLEKINSSARITLQLFRDIATEQLTTARNEFLGQTGIRQGVRSFDASVMNQFTAEAMSGVGRSIAEIAASMTDTHRIMGLTVDQAREFDRLLQSVSGTTRDEMAQSFAEVVEQMDAAGLITDDTLKIIQQMGTELGLVEAIQEAVTKGAESEADARRKIVEATLSQMEAQAEARRLGGEILSGLMQQVALNQVIMASGRDSVEVERLRADQGRVALEQRLQEEKVADDLAEQILKAYDLIVQQEGAMRKTAQATEDAAKAAEALANALQMANSFSRGLDQNVATLEARLAEAKGQQGAVLALTVQQMEAEARLNAQRAIASGEDAVIANARLGIDLAQIARFKELNKEIEKYGNTSRTSGRRAVDALTDAEKAALDYAKSLDNQVLSAIGSVSQAWGDFVVRGFRDFKGFANAVLNSFKSMVANMIAIAARNRIMLSLGIGGVGAGAATSAAGSIGGSAAGSLLSGGGMLAGTGVGTALAGMSGGFQAALGLGGYSSAGLFSVGANAAVGSAATGAGAIASTIGAVAAPLLAVAAVFSFFSSKTKELDNGLRVTVKNMDSFVESFSQTRTTRFWGLDVRNRTTTTAMAADNPVSQSIFEIQNSIFQTAQYLGIATDALNTFSYDFRVSLQGLTEEQKTQKITEELVKMGNAFAALLPNIESMEQLTAVLNERVSLEIRLLRVQGDTQALRERELASVHEYNRGILEQIFAAEDAAAATAQLNAALNSLSENNFATLLDFRRAQAAIRMGMPVANTPAGIPTPSIVNSPVSMSSSSNGTSGEVAQLRADMKEMHKEVMFAYSKLIKNSKDSRDTLRGWDIVGIPPERTA